MSSQAPAICHSCAMFLRALSILALPAETQVEWLRSLGLGEPGLWDELADEYDQHWLMLPQIVEAGLIPEKAVGGLNQLNDLLAALVDSDAADGPMEALRTSNAWQEVRKMARSCLFQLK